MKIPDANPFFSIVLPTRNRPDLISSFIKCTLEQTFQNFELIICGDDMAKKPSPEPLLFACKKLNIEASKAIMIGDSKSDILAAKAAGIDVIAVGYGYNQGENLADYNPQYLCDNFLDIIPVLTQR